MATMHRSVKVASTGLSLAVAVALAGCTQSTKHQTSAAGSPTVGSSSHSSKPPSKSGSATGLPSGVTGATSVPASPPNVAKLRTNVTMNACKATSGGWAASGDARNPGTNSVDYNVSVFFTTAAATVIGSGSAKVSVQPGGTEKWTVTGKFHPAAKTLCVLVGVA
ncbi:hypothetical protein BH10ACT8_BH10ACT8_16860 [soil metagenome]